MHEPVRLYALDCAFLADPVLFEKYYALQPAWRKNRIDGLKMAADRRLSLGAGLLLQKALPGADLSAVLTGENGKPYLKDAGVSFSLSHAGAYALCAVGPEELGCDIEKIRPLHAGVAERFFHPEELALLRAEPDAAVRERLFFRLWTLKESYIKATGKGLSQPLGSFCVLWDESGPFLKGLGDRYTLKEYAAPEGYACAVCAPAGSRFAETINYIHPEGA